MSLQQKTKYLDYRIEGLDWDASRAFCKEAEKKDEVMAVNTSGGIVISFPSLSSYQVWFKSLIERYKVDFERIN